MQNWPGCEHGLEGRHAGLHEITSPAPTSRGAVPMPYPTALTHLACTPVFGALPVPALEQLAAASRRCRYKRGQIIIHQGDPAAAVYLLASGRVKVVSSTEDGEEVLLAVL